MRRRLLGSGLSVVMAATADAATHSADVIIYSAAPGGITSAIEAKRMGRSVILLEPKQRIGGLTASPWTAYIPAMILGQSAGAAAALAIEQGISVQR